MPPVTILNANTLIPPDPGITSPRVDWPAGALGVRLRLLMTQFTNPADRVELRIRYFWPSGDPTEYRARYAGGQLLRDGSAPYVLLQWPDGPTPDQVEGQLLAIAGTPRVGLTAEVLTG